MSSALTPSHRRWVLPEFGDVFPTEPRSTCDDCAMCRPFSPAPDMAQRFDPSLKCCTYSPDLANFLVGRVLSDSSTAAGAERLRAAVARRAATPLGIEPTPAFDRRYRLDARAFGKDRALRCPFEDAGRCGIWAHRNPVCQTFFCKVDGGVPSDRVWRGLARLLLYADEAVAADNVVALLGHPEALRRLYDDQGRRRRTARGGLAGVADDGTIEPDLYAALWGDWIGREEVFFAACAERADAMSWEDVRRIGGPPLAGITAELHERLRTRDGAPPEALRVAALGVDVTWGDAVDGDIAAVSLTNLHDPIVIPAATWEGLTSEPEATIAALPPAERARLWRAGLLEAGGAPASTSDWLGVPPDRHCAERITFDADGRATVTLDFGATELVFDEPELLVFARTLFARRSGFRTEEAQGWGPPERVAETLDTLVGMGVLTRG